MAFLQGAPSSAALMDPILLASFGLAGMFVRAIEGSASNVIGLPLAETMELLARAGHPLPWSAA